ncbi:hypothetical protein WMZ97_04270 [Lentibacillus sp. N15]|uniref:hypothetical protein n=1 Tax=Lentibacillus songyuanensis TaxID=3136161 RepID=UPI0031BB3F8E
MHQILLVLHILLAIVWVGGILFVGWGVYPVAKKFPYPQQRHWLQALMQWTHWLFTAAGLGVIITGILLGTVLGPIQQWRHVWETNYGHIWLTALIIAVVTLLWGIFIGYKQSMNVFTNDALWERAEHRDTKPLAKAMLITAALESVEIIGFIALIVCMVLLGS